MVHGAHFLLYCSYSFLTVIRYKMKTNPTMKLEREKHMSTMLGLLGKVCTMDLGKKWRSTNLTMNIT